MKLLCFTICLVQCFVNILCQLSLGAGLGDNGLGLGVGLGLGNLGAGVNLGIGGRQPPQQDNRMNSLMELLAGLGLGLGLGGGRGCGGGCHGGQVCMQNTCGCPQPAVMMAGMCLPPPLPLPPPPPPPPMFPALGLYPPVLPLYLRRALFGIIKKA